MSLRKCFHNLIKRNLYINIKLLNNLTKLFNSNIFSDNNKKYNTTTANDQLSNHGILVLILLGIPDFSRQCYRYNVLKVDFSQSLFQQK